MVDKTIHNTTLNEVFTISECLYIFKLKFTASFVGRERHRIANRYGLSFLPVHTKSGYLRSEVSALACFLDMIADDYFLEPSIEDSQAQFLSVLPQLPALYERAILLEESYFRAKVSENVAPSYPDIPIANYLTVNQVCEITHLSRESVYAKSDIRGGKGGWKTVKYQDIHLWLPDQFL